MSHQHANPAKKGNIITKRGRDLFVLTFFSAQNFELKAVNQKSFQVHENLAFFSHESRRRKKRGTLKFLYKPCTQKLF